MRRVTIFWRWEVLVIALAEATLALAFVGPATMLRSGVVLVFLAFCPGLCVLRLLGLRLDLSADIAYSVAVSLVIVGVLGGITLYADAWSPQHLTNYLAAGAIILAAMAVTVGTGRSRELRRNGKP